MHSISPAIHNAAFRHKEIDAVYLPLAAADFDDFLQFADGVGIEGASVTAPFKLDAFARAEHADSATLRVGAANTVKRRGRGWVACNTDMAGFLAPLSSTMSLMGARVVVLGAGGAARSVAEALCSTTATDSICARRAQQAENVARHTGAAVCSWPPAPDTWDVLVNTTPIGTAPDVDASPLPDGPFTGQLVYDLVYNPPETRLLRDAKAAGCRTLGGLEMLIAQAQRQFEWWTDTAAPERVMRDAAVRALGNPTVL